MEDLNNENTELKNEIQNLIEEIQEINSNIKGYELKWIHKSYLWNKPNYFEKNT